MAEEEEEQAAEQQAEVLSDTGLFYLHYANDSGLRTALAATAELQEALWTTVAAAEMQRVREYNASVLLQAVLRRRQRRAGFADFRTRAVTVERVFRGHRGRNGYEDEQQARDARTRRAFWNSNAALVQKIWRGFYSRKHIHNFYLRKAYLDSVTQTGLARRQELEEHFERLYDMETQRVQQQRLEKFEKVVGSLHHMLSTGTCAGVYNSPYDQMAPATAYGLPIEDHLRNVVKGTLRSTILGLNQSQQGQAQTWVRGPTGKDSEYGYESLGPEGGAWYQEDASSAGAGGQLYAYSTKPIKITRQ